MKTINQRAAHRLARRVQSLEAILNAQRLRYSQEWMGGIEIARHSWIVSDQIPTAVRTAHALRHAVVVTCDVSGLMKFIALPLPESKL